MSYQIYKTSKLPKWSDFFNDCINVAALNCHFICRINEKVLAQIDSDLICIFLERSFQFHSFSNMDNGSIVEVMQKINGLDNVFALYKSELGKALTVDPPLQIKWTVKLCSNIYKESESITYLQSKWEMELWKLKDDLIHITLKYLKLDPPKENEFVITSDTIVIMVCFVEIAECPEFNKKLTTHFITNSKTTAELLTFPYSSITTGSVSLKLSFKIDYISTGIINYISNNFNWLFMDKNLQCLDKYSLITILKHKKVNIKKEDHALMAVIAWKMKNHNESLKELMDNILWDYLSLELMIYITKKFPFMRADCDFKKCFGAEITKRSTQTKITQPPRPSFKNVKSSKEDFKTMFVRIMLHPVEDEFVKMFGA